MSKKPTYEELEQRVEELEEEAAKHKQVGEALRISENKHSAIFNLSPCPMGMSTFDAVSIDNLNGETIYINPAFMHTFGFTMEDIAGQGIPLVPESFLICLRNG